MKKKSKSKILLKLNVKGKKLNLNAIKLKSPLEKARGLTFRSKKNAKALLFEMKKPLAIHSLFVFFPFVAVWMDEKKKVIEIKKVRPFKLHIKPKKQSSKLLEIPINNRYKKILEKLDIN